MIKVINVITDTNIGGAGKCLLAFLDNYDRNEIDLEIFIPFNSALKPEIVARKVKFTEVEHIAEQSFDMDAVFKLGALFAQKQPQIVHTHASMSARIAAKFHGKCKVVSTRHSVFDQPKKYKTFPLKQTFGLVNHLLSDVIIAVSPAAKENLTDIGTDAEKIVVVLNGVDKLEPLISAQKLAIREKYTLAKEDFVVCIIARLEDVKGHDYVLDCAKLLLEKDKSVKIIVAGSGTNEQKLRQRVKDENLQNVIITGFIKEIYELENIMDLQINASYGTEATSLSLLEGMSLGVPAVVSDFGGNPFVIKAGINGIVVPKKDAVALFNGITTLKNDKELYNKLQTNSKQHFLENYTSKIMTDNITQVYKKLVEKL